MPSSWLHNEIIQTFERCRHGNKVDLKDRHIRVNVISPGTIDTGIFVGVPKEVKDQFVSIIPMGRIGQPHEIAAAALFLASDDSSFVTGIELFVDGGTAQI